MIYELVNRKYFEKNKGVEKISKEIKNERKSEEKQLGFVKTN